MKPTVAMVKEVREKTGLGLTEIIHAFTSVEKQEDVYGVLQQYGVESLERRQARHAGHSVIHSYVHGGKFGAMITFHCETDFVAKSSEFQQFMRDICMHVAATPLPAECSQWFGNKLEDSSFLEQRFVKDESKTIGDLIADISAKTGEKIEIGLILRQAV